MFAGIAIGIGIAIVFLNNQGAGTSPTPPGGFNYVQQNGLNFVQQNGSSVFLEN